MKPEMLRTLERIFSDAQVVDVDFANWDRSIDLYVLADHMPHHGERLPLFLIRFLQPQSFKLTLHETPDGLESHQHVQWRVHDLKITEDGGAIQITLWELPPSPEVEIACGSISVEELDINQFDRMFPGWDRPFAPLARPGPRAWRRDL